MTAPANLPRLFGRQRDKLRWNTGEAAGTLFFLILTKRSDAGCAERQARVRTDTIGHGERCLTMPYFLKGVVL